MNKYHVEGLKGIHIEQLVTNVMLLDNISLMKELEPKNIIPCVINMNIIAYLCRSGGNYECKRLLCKCALLL